MATNASQNQKIGRLNTRAQRESSRWIAPTPLPFFSLFATRPIVLHYLIHPSSTSTSDLASPSNCPQRVSAFTREYQGKRIDTIDHKKGQVFIIDQGSCQISRRFHRGFVFGRPAVFPLLMHPISKMGKVEFPPVPVLLVFVPWYAFSQRFPRKEKHH